MLRNPHSAFRDSLDAQFGALHERAVAIARAATPELLFRQPKSAASASSPSCGEHLIRAAACVEQTFGGLTANLWDDPFEWTLPESLATGEKLLEYLHEVEATRLRGFALIASDEDLTREIFVPAEERFGGMKTIAALLIETLARAADHQGRALATLRLFTNVALLGKADL